MTNENIAYTEGDEPIKAMIDACNVMSDEEKQPGERKLSAFLKSIAG